MVYFGPSVEVRDRMVSELAGVFIDRALNPPPCLWLVAKLPMNLIREVRVGAELSLLVWVVQVDDFLVLAFRLRVFDDGAAPFTTFGCCRSDAEARRSTIDSSAVPMRMIAGLAITFSARLISCLLF